VAKGRVLVTVVVAASGSVKVSPPAVGSVEVGRLATARELSVRTKERSELMDTLLDGTGLGGGRVLGTAAGVEVGKATEGSEVADGGGGGSLDEPGRRGRSEGTRGGSDEGEG
jgi:hypothetical protein